MPPRSLRASKAGAGVLPEAAQVAFLVDAAHLMAVKAPAMSAYLGRRALEVRQRHNLYLSHPSIPTRPPLSPARRYPGACRHPATHPFSGQAGRRALTRSDAGALPAASSSRASRAQVSQAKKVPLPKGAAQKLCQRCGAILQLTEPDR